MNRAVWAALLAFAWILSGCEMPRFYLEGGGGINIQNDTPSAVEVFYGQGGSLRSYGRIEPGDTESLDFDIYDGRDVQCTTEDIIVRSLDGRELYRIRPPQCHRTNIPLSQCEMFSGESCDPA